ncbi:AAA family ATPase [Mycobacteroides abscessus]|uniref:AAA family ATPase n=2 Tax=Mycobacteroides abscessus TaxID=36809 RepID=A0ABD7HLM3_9MYCO|nr:AAA family ATPase [Mycobacteroides abscessus]
MQVTNDLPRSMVRLYSEALGKWVESLAYNTAGDVTNARELAVAAANRFDYIAQELTIERQDGGDPDPHPDAVIAQYAIGDYMNPGDREFSTDELEALNRHRNLIGTLYQAASAFHAKENQGQRVERPYATFGWKEAGIKWALSNPADARAALALRYIETKDLAKADELLGPFDSGKCPALEGAHMILLAQAGLWDTLIDVAATVATRYSHERTVAVAPGDPDALGHTVRLNTWYLAKYLQALAYASLGEFDTAEPIFTEVESAQALPVLTALAAFDHARMAHTQGKAEVASRLLTESVRIHTTQRAHAAMSTGLMPLRVTSKDLIALRRDRWDPETEPDPELSRQRKLKSEQAQMLEQAELKLQEVVGLHGLKAEMQELKFSIAEEAVLRSRGIATKGSNFNAILYGHPGTGKTTITEYLALVFCAYGLVDHPKPKILHRADLVIGFQGQSETHTRELLTKYIGWFILFDEAYAIAYKPDGNGAIDPFGLAVLDTIVAMSESLYQQNTVMAMAGYPEEMRGLLEINSGLSSRFPLRYEFASYTNAELYEILVIRSKERGKNLDREVQDLFTGDDFAILQRVVAPGTLFADKMANARFMRDLMEAAGRVGSARRASTGRDPHSFTDAELAQVTAEDVETAFWRLVEPKAYLLSG